MLFGRESELQRIADVIDAARRGVSGTLLLRGEPGIGKSALLDAAVANAADLRIVRARGIESEAELPFAGLHELLHGLFHLLPRIPPAQADALSAALALGPPGRGDRLAVAAGAMSLLAAAAEESPLLVVVDDAHWLDDASAEALRFAFRRVDAEAIAVLLAARDGEPNAFDDAALPTLPVSGLDTRAATRLLAAHAMIEPPPSVVERLVFLTRGNPLALAELGGMLSPAQLAGRDDLPEPLPATRAILAAFRRRVDALPEATARALVVAAADEAGDLAVLAGAFERLGLDADALGAAEDEALVEISGRRVTWRHPLLRAAVYHGASPPQRRAAHSAIAAALANERSPRRAWHLAEAASGPDAEAAAALEEAAATARARHAHLAAARSFERAGRLSSDGGSQARRLTEAARDYQLLGRLDHARALLDEAHRDADGDLRADIRRIEGSLEMWAGDAQRALAVLSGAADEIREGDPVRALGLLADATLALQMSGDVRATVVAARRAAALAESIGPERARDFEPILLNSQILAGEGPEAGERLLAIVEEGGAEPDELHHVASMGHALAWLGEHEGARAIFEAELTRSRDAGLFGPMPYLLASLCELHFRTGRWDDAYAMGAESVRLAEETGQHNLACFCLVSLARVEAGRGLGQDCRLHAHRALELASALGVGSITVYGHSVLGFLELGAGRPEAALAELLPLRERVISYGLGEPGVVHWRSDFVEALILMRDAPAARAELDVLEEEAARTGRRWALAVAARCRGMLVPDFEEAFAEAAAIHERDRMPFEQARTQLRLGERLRRDRRPTEAREPLRSALGRFEDLGAEPWAARARAELAAAGARPPPARRAGSHELTPQELRIALLVAEGATNREVAAMLFLSPKTVGYHLGKVYDKLGLRSRTELARQLATQPAGAETHVPARPRRL